jgi:valyl-tRNA synthetase
MLQLAKNFMNHSYNYHNFEEKLINFWEENKIYSWNPQLKDEIFSIDTPPPTISGNLHLGHIFSYTQTDFIARFQRMLGKNVFYPIGFDNNGLPTERLVEKIKDIKSSNMSRSDFIQLCQEVIPKFAADFKELFQKIGLSFDWDQSYQTINPYVQKLSQLSFIDLYQKGKIYRKLSPVFWDPVDQTAIAQAEIEDKEKEGTIYFINFSIKDSSRLITIATTRPELLGACVAIFVHPEDERYKSLVGMTATTPEFNLEVKILTDSEVLPEKGSGAVMCCSFGDIQDLNWIQKYNLPIIEVITKEGKIINSGFLNGLYIKDARKAIVEALEGYIIKKEPIKQQVKSAERSGAPLEIISTEQWFISILNAKDAILDKANQCHWHPEYMKVRLENWVKGLNQDWCISRQRHFGIPFPVWYSKKSGEEGKILLPKIEQLPVDPIIDLPEGYSRSEVVADNDVMDTWATSAITPQINSGAISSKYYLDLEKHKKIFPFDLRPQAHEIIRIWAFGTLVKSLYHENTIPWKNLMISGWCLAKDKSKMSKSKGNFVDPVKILAEEGADVVRYWAASSKLGNDIIFSEDAFKIGRKLILKLINAANFIKLHLPKLDIALQNREKALTAITESLDHWILAKLDQVIALVEKSFINFDYYTAKILIEDFFWNYFCDNYLELIKDRLYKEYDKKEGQSAIVTLLYLLERILKLLAPFLPFITENLYQAFYPEKGSIHQKGSWPAKLGLKANLEGDLIVNILILIRKAKATKGLSVGTNIRSVKITSSQDLSPSALYDLKSGAKAISLQVISGKELSIELED